MTAHVYNGMWFVLNKETKEYLESHPTKPEAMKVVNDLNEEDKKKGKLPRWAVVPGSSDKIPRQT